MKIKPPINLCRSLFFIEVKKLCCVANFTNEVIQFYNLAWSFNT